MTHYDFIIVGTGAGGGTIARKLAEAGKRILILERGGFLPSEDDNSDPAAVFGGKYSTPETWLINGKRTEVDGHHRIGGKTKLYGAALFRLRPADFGEVVHEDGVSPAWPVTYADLEPFYTSAEWMYRVHGEHGEDSTEGAWSAQYPYPAVPHSPVIQKLSDDLTRAGYRPFHAPAGVLLQAGGPCVRCNACDGFPCKVAGKSDAETIGITPIKDYPNVTLLTGAEVVRVVADARGTRITDVVVRMTAFPLGSRIQSYSADNVILAAGAVATARILLQSGLGGDAVGRHYMTHNSRAVIAVGATPNTTVFQKTMAVHDFYDAFGSIQMVGKSSGQAMRSEDALAALMPDWPLEKIARHAVDFWLTTEDLPLYENRISLAADGSTRLDYQYTNRVESVQLYARLRHMLREAGHRYLFASMTIPLSGNAHQAGTARMGTDPATSVVDTDCKVHGLGNLYVADSSVMVSLGAVNPALTVMALSLRLADHLLTQ